MTVYVDDMYKYPLGEFRNMKMSHLIADTEEELLTFVKKIGVNPKWIQHRELGKGNVHFDISLSKRRLAIQYGAKQITLKELSILMKKWREEKLESNN